MNKRPPAYAEDLWMEIHAAAGIATVALEQLRDNSEQLLAERTIITLLKKLHAV